jgi:hypothetical protein
MAQPLIISVTTNIQDIAAAMDLAWSRRESTKKERLMTEDFRMSHSFLPDTVF